jgi:gas vesicle protein
MSENGGGSFFLGFLIGAMAGAAAALLMTPQSGEEMRHILEQRGAELKGDAARRAEEARIQAQRLAEDAKLQAQRLADDAKAQAQRLATDAKGQVEYVQERGRVVISDNVRKAQQAVSDVQGKVTGRSAMEPPTTELS